MKYKYLFFDLDRTLWDFEKNTIETLQEIYTDYSLKLYFDSFHEFHSTYRQINEQLWEKYRNKEISKDELRDERFYLTLKEKGYQDKSLSQKIGIDYINKTPNKTALFPNTHEVLTELSKKYTMYVLTNGFKEVQIKKVNNCNLTPYFKEIFTSEDAGVQKPNAQFFRFVLDTINAQVNEAIMIGDDLKVDILGAQNVNMDTIFFNTNNQNHNEKPTYEIFSLKELLEIL